RSWAVSMRMPCRTAMSGGVSVWGMRRLRLPAQWGADGGAVWRQILPLSGNLRYPPRQQARQRLGIHEADAVPCRELPRGGRWRTQGYVNAFPGAGGRQCGVQALQRIDARVRSLPAPRG